MSVLPYLLNINNVSSLPCLCVHRLYIVIAWQRYFGESFAISKLEVSSFFWLLANCSFSHDFFPPHVTSPPSPPSCHLPSLTTVKPQQLNAASQNVNNFLPATFGWRNIFHHAVPSRHIISWWKSRIAITSVHLKKTMECTAVKIYHHSKWTIWFVKDITRTWSEAIIPPRTYPHGPTRRGASTGTSITQSAHLDLRIHFKVHSSMVKFYQNLKISRKVLELFKNLSKFCIS